MVKKWGDLGLDMQCIGRFQMTKTEMEMMGW